MDPAGDEEEHERHNLRSDSYLAAFDPPRDAEPSSYEEPTKQEEGETEIPTVLTKLQKWVRVAFVMKSLFVCSS